MFNLKAPTGVTFDYVPTPLAGRTVLLTGGTTGIGRTTALLLAANGARVLLFGRHGTELGDAMADFKKAGLTVAMAEDASAAQAAIVGLIADAAVIDDLKRVFATVDQIFGKKLDALVNNAGVAIDKLEDASLEDIDYAIRTNTTAYLWCAKLAAERMGEGGHVINVGSMSAEERGGGSPIYVASKSAVRGMSASLRKGLGEKGIKVTLIEPGATGADIQKYREQNETLPPQNKRMKAEDIAVAIALALVQPARCDVVSMQLEPLDKST